MDPDSRRLRVSVTDAEGRPLRDGGLARWLELLEAPRARGEVAVALVSDGRVRALNRQYRGADRTTDVLAFPASTGHDAMSVGRRPRPLGDIVIARGVARRRARDAGHSEQTELRVLALHGLLHLLGHDHHHAGDRKRMARLEERLRRRGGLPTGLIERGIAGRPAKRRDT